METSTKTKKGRLRSPNYPAFPLDEAVSKINILWEKDGKAGSHRSVVLKHLGFNAESGSALRNLSTLRSFGLTSEKNRHIILTDIALDIVLYSHDEQIYYRSLQEAALNPNIFRELYEKHSDGLPSDDALKSELIREYDFNPKVVDNFIDRFRTTLNYAKLLNGGMDRIDKRPIKEDMDKMKGQGNISTYTEPSQITGQSFPIPFLKGNKATIVFDKLPVQKSDLEKIKSWIDLFEESLVEVNKENEEP
jgi:hypothetical protein